MKATVESIRGTLMDGKSNLKIVFTSEDEGDRLLLIEWYRGMKGRKNPEYQSLLDSGVLPENVFCKDDFA
jgi:hypothetical protein